MHIRVRSTGCGVLPWTTLNVHNSPFNVICENWRHGGAECSIPYHSRMEMLHSYMLAKENYQNSGRGSQNSGRGSQNMDQFSKSEGLIRWE